jgi:hypothetical protein
LVVTAVSGPAFPMESVGEADDTRLSLAQQDFQVTGAQCDTDGACPEYSWSGQVECAALTLSRVGNEGGQTINSTPHLEIAPDANTMTGAATSVLDPGGTNETTITATAQMMRER